MTHFCGVPNTSSSILDLRENIRSILYLTIVCTRYFLWMSDISLLWREPYTDNYGPHWESTACTNPPLSCQISRVPKNTSTSKLDSSLNAQKALNHKLSIRGLEKCIEGRTARGIHPARDTAPVTLFIPWSAPSPLRYQDTGPQLLLYPSAPLWTTATVLRLYHQIGALITDLSSSTTSNFAWERPVEIMDPRRVY